MRRLVQLLVTVVLVVGLLAAGDWAAGTYAEQRAADALTGTLAAVPDVDIDGYPFLTQWGSGNYRGATVTADQVTLGKTRVIDFELVLTDVRTPGYANSAEDFRTGTAASVRASGTVPYAALPLPPGATAKRDGEATDRVKLSGRVEVLGQSIKYTAVVKVSLEDDTVMLAPQRVDVLGGIGSAAATALVRDRLDTAVELPGLPPGMRMSSMTVADGGVRLVATGWDVEVPSP